MHPCMREIKPSLRDMSVKFDRISHRFSLVISTPQADKSALILLINSCLSTACNIRRLVSICCNSLAYISSTRLYSLSFNVFLRCDRLRNISASLSSKCARVALLSGVYVITVCSQLRHEPFKQLSWQHREIAQEC